MFLRRIFGRRANESYVKTGQFGVSWELSYHTSQIDGLKDGIDDKELCSKLCSVGCIFRALISNGGGDGERYRIFSVRVDVVSVFTFDACYDYSTAYVCRASPG